MRVSDIPNGRGTWCQMPANDAYRGVGDEDARQAFIAEHGDVEVIQERDSYYAVPEFAESRRKYIDAKIKACNEWGCE